MSEIIDSYRTEVDNAEAIKSVMAFNAQLLKTKSAFDSLSASVVKYTAEITKAKTLTQSFKVPTFKTGISGSSISGSSINDQTIRRLRSHVDLQFQQSRAQDKLERQERKLLGLRSAMAKRLKELRSRIREMKKEMQGTVSETKKAKESSNELTVSWKTLGRVVGVQLIHRAIAAMVTSMREGVIAAKDLQIALSEIRTISQSNQLTFERWGEVVRGISDKFGDPIQDVAEGVYQAISNQIAKGEEVQAFLEDSLTFGRVAVTSSADAVNLLSAALNAYELTAEDAENVSATLFKTIELGRIRGSDLANTFGRVGQLASRLGIEMTELGAAISTVTIQGIRPSQSLTLIRNIMLKLIKPTGKMTELLNEWGVESGEAAIRTFGLAEVFERMSRVLEEEGSPAFGELLGRIRAIQGGLIFTGDEVGRYQDRLRQMFKAQGDYAKAAEITMESYGKKLAIEFQQLRNIFVKDVGDNIINTLGKINEEYFDFSSTLSSSAPIIKNTALAVGTLTVAYGSATLATIGFAAAQKKLNLLLLTNPVGATVVALTALTFSVKAFADSAEDSSERVKRIYKELDKSRQELGKRIRREIQEESKEQLRALKEYEREVRKYYLTRRKEAKDNLKFQKEVLIEENKALRIQLDNALNDIKKNLKAREKEIKDSYKTIQEAQEDIFDIRSGDTLKELRERLIFELGERKKVDKKYLDFYKKLNAEKRFLELKTKEVLTRAELKELRTLEHEQEKSLKRLQQKRFKSFDFGEVDLKTNKEIVKEEKRTAYETYQLRLKLLNELRREQEANAKALAKSQDIEGARGAIEEAVRLTKEFEKFGIPISEIIKEIQRLDQVRIALDQKEIQKSKERIEESKAEAEKLRTTRDKLIKQQRDLLDLEQDIIKGREINLNKLKNVYDNILNTMQDISKNIPTEVVLKVQQEIKKQKEKAETTLEQEEKVERVNREEKEILKDLKETTNNLEKVTKERNKIVQGEADRAQRLAASLKALSEVTKTREKVSKILDLGADETRLEQSQRIKDIQTALSALATIDAGTIQQTSDLEIRRLTEAFKTSLSELKGVSPTFDPKLQGDLAEAISLLISETSRRKEFKELTQSQKDLENQLGNLKKSTNDLTQQNKLLLFGYENLSKELRNLNKLDQEKKGEEKERFEKEIIRQREEEDIKELKNLLNWRPEQDTKEITQNTKEIIRQTEEKIIDRPSEINITSNSVQELQDAWLTALENFANQDTTFTPVVETTPKTIAQTITESLQIGSVNINVREVADAENIEELRMKLERSERIKGKIFRQRRIG